MSVISRSQTDVQPVFDTIAASALRLCDVELQRRPAVLTAPYPPGSAQQPPPESEHAIQTSGPSHRVAAPPLRARSWIVRSLQIATSGGSGISNGHGSGGRELSKRRRGPDDARGNADTVRSLSRARRPANSPRTRFNLLRTFADQAVIAIENVRLFNETKESARAQTATGGDPEGHRKLSDRRPARVRRHRRGGR
jgi:hypothetical protein